MMTASSVEFFPCRVQHIGLPRSAASQSANGASTTTLQTPPRRPPMEKLHGVSRNLFGSPEPGEINSMFQQETKRHHSYVFQRYNIDISALRAKVQPTNSVAAPRQPTQLPTLIAQELKQHEQRLQKEECNLNRAAAASEITPPNAKLHQQQGCAVVNKIMRRCCGEDGLKLQSATSMERQKPYDRQPLLTESFNLRKNKICSPSSSLSLSSSSSSSSPSPPSSQTVANAETLSLHSLIDTHRNVQVLKLPQAMQAEWKGEINDMTTNDNTEEDTAEEDADEDCSTGSTGSQRQRSTTLSLKLVVSTQNAASTTTSSTSREHKHHA